MLFLYFFCVITIALETVVCRQNYPITIGSGTVVDPSAHINAKAGPVVIGKNNIIAANAVIANRRSPGSTGSGSVSLIIGDGNVFHASSRSESLQIGNGNVIGVGASLDRRVVLTNGCVIGAGCSITGPQTLSPGTVLIGC